MPCWRFICSKPLFSSFYINKMKNCEQNEELGQTVHHGRKDSLSQNLTLNVLFHRVSSASLHMAQNWLKVFLCWLFLSRWYYIIISFTYSSPTMELPSLIDLLDWFFHFAFKYYRSNQGYECFDTSVLCNELNYEHNLWVNPNMHQQIE